MNAKINDAKTDEVEIVELGTVVEETRHSSSGSTDNVHQQG